MSRTLPLILSMLFVVAIITASRADSIDPYASSEAVLIDYTFTLPANVTAVYYGPDRPFRTYIGDAGTSFPVDEVNFGTLPKPDGYEYSIRHEYSVYAEAPPPEFSAAYFELSSSFYFNSTNDDDVFLTVNYTVTYDLFTEGTYSYASIGIDYLTKGPSNQGVPETALLPTVSVSDGGMANSTVNSTLVLQLYPGQTQWTIYDPVTAAAAIPEPATLPMLLTGIVFLLGFSRGYPMVDRLRRWLERGGFCRTSPLLRVRF